MGTSVQRCSALLGHRGCAQENQKHAFCLVPFCRMYCTINTSSPYFINVSRFDVHVTMQRDKFLIINQPDAPISQIYFGRKSYVFRTVPLSIIRSFSLYTLYRVFWELTSRILILLASCHKNLYDIYHCCVYSGKTPDDGQRNCPKHVVFPSKIIWEIGTSGWFIKRKNSPDYFRLPPRSRWVLRSSGLLRREWW